MPFDRGKWRSLEPLAVIALSVATVHRSAAQPGDRLERLNDPPARVSPDGIWESVDVGQVAAVAGEPWVQPERFTMVALRAETLAGTLARTPMEFAAVAAGDEAVVTLPMPDGTFARFRVFESPIMEPPLAAMFPEIKTYAGQGIDDPTASVRFDWTPAGLHAQVLSPTGAVYVDPYWRDDTTHYASYFKADHRRGGEPFSCQLRPGPVGAEVGSVAGISTPSGDTLRTYRLACAATGEYTQFHGGTVNAGMAAIVTAMNRVNGIYEVEVAARMVLVANNNLIVYTNGATDPYSNNNGGAMLDQNQANLNAVIGNSNYDIGHVFSTGGGGIAGLGVVCFSGGKSWGVTGLPSPIGDSFYVDYVAHEMGHQFGANHSFNGVNSNCSGGNRNGPTAFEPGSGSTIMAYAGICGPDNLQPHSDPYFHTISYDEIRQFVANGPGGNCDVVTATGNGPPTVSAGLDYAIPRGTPFVLTGSGSDPDGDPLTYCWEEQSLGPAAALSAPDDGQIPLFRSFNPTLNPSRTFPRMTNLLNNTPSNAEKIPTVDRLMPFKLVARDNRAGGGGVSYDDMFLTVDGSKGPFVITAPLASSQIVADSPLDVAWDVAGTNTPPINVAEVDILLSPDGSEDFSMVLAANTANDGAETVMVPNVAITSGRIMVQAVGNVFFAVSGTCPVPAAPSVESLFVSNRYLSFHPNNAGRATAVRVVLTNLPVPFSFLNGTTMWVGPPQEFSENAGTRLKSQAPGLPGFWAATLQCTPHYFDWGSLGTVHVYHEAIIPGGRYTVSAVDSLCDAGVAASFSGPLSITQSGYGDVAGPYNSGGGFWPGPDNRKDITVDVVSVLEKFGNRPSAPIKARMDTEPGLVDGSINITDVTRTLDGFRGAFYPFPPPAFPCP